MLIQPDYSPTVAREKKRMLEVTTEVWNSKLQRYYVCANYSSIEIIQTCLRKAHYAIQRNLISQDEPAALIFGNSTHKGLEYWYTMPRDVRNSPEVIKRALEVFRETAKPLETLDYSDKRHPSNGERILEAYFKRYAEDPYEVVRNGIGDPIVEADFQFTMVDKPDLRIDYFGRIDLVLRNADTGTVLVTDHKTTTSLGVDFFNRIAPNHQYTGYLMGIQKCFNIPTNEFMVNGIQVAKTKVDFARQITTRSDDDFAELTAAVEWNVRNYLHCLRESKWVMNSPNPCTQYGGCSYRQICAAPKNLREDMIRGLFKQR